MARESNEDKSLWSHTLCIFKMLECLQLDFKSELKFPYLNPSLCFGNSQKARFLPPEAYLFFFFFLPLVLMSVGKV